MRRILVPTLALLLASCATAPAVETDAAPPPAPDGLRVAEMQALETRVDAAVAHGELTRLRDALEAAAVNHTPWSEVEAAYAQRREDADAAWNRLREVTVMTAEPGPSYWARLGMADVYLEWGVLDQAKVQLDAALKIAPATAPALLREGRLAAARDDAEGARAAWKKALAVGGGPNGTPAAAVALAGLDHARGEDAAARALVGRVLAAHPDRVDALLLAADVAEGEEAAVPLLERAVKAAPNDADLKVRLARARSDAGDEAGALAAWQAVTVDRPADLAAWRTQVSLAQALGDAGAERAALEQVARLDSDDVDALRRLADLQTAAGEAAAADASLTELLARTPDDGAARLARGRLRESRQDFLGALGDYRAAAAAGEAGAEGAAKALSERLGMPARRISGRSPEAVYRGVLRVLGPAYLARLKELPRLGGTYAVKVWVEGGKVAESEVAENTLHDPVIEALAWWLVKDASFPKRKGRKEFTLPFTFSPPD